MLAADRSRRHRRHARNGAMATSGPPRLRAGSARPAAQPAFAVAAHPVQSCPAGAHPSGSGAAERVDRVRAGRSSARCGASDDTARATRRGGQRHRSARTARRADRRGRPPPGRGLRTGRRTARASGRRAVRARASDWRPRTLPWPSRRRCSARGRRGAGDRCRHSMAHADGSRARANRAIVGPLRRRFRDPGGGRASR